MLPHTSCEREHGDVDISAKPRAACTAAPHRAGEADRSLLWSSKSARTHRGRQQQTARRSHAWGASLFTDAVSIPYSNKAFEATKVSRKGRLPGCTTRAATRKLGAKVLKNDLPAPAVELPAVTHPRSCSAGRALPGPHPSIGSAKAHDAPRLDLPEPHHSLHATSGLEALHQPHSAPGSAIRQGFVQRCNQGFWQELQGVLSQLPDHRGAVNLPPTGAQQLQSEIAAAADVQIPLARCHALACLAPASSYRGLQSVSSSDKDQLPGQAAQQAAQQSALVQALTSRIWQGVPLNIQDYTPAQPALQARLAPVEAHQHTEQSLSARSEQARGHVSMHDMLAHARGTPRSPACKQASDPHRLNPTTGTLLGDTSASLGGGLRPDSSIAVHARLELPLSTAGVLLAHRGANQQAAARPVVAVQQAEHQAWHTAAQDQRCAEGSGHLHQAARIAHHQAVVVPDAHVATSKANTALGQSQQTTCNDHTATHGVAGATSDDLAAAPDDAAAAPNDNAATPDDAAATSDDAAAIPDATATTSVGAATTSVDAAATSDDAAATLDAATITSSDAFTTSGHAAATPNAAAVDAADTPGHAITTAGHAAATPASAAATPEAEQACATRPTVAVRQGALPAGKAPNAKHQARQK